MALTLPVTTIEGTLTADPELRFTNSGTAVANLNIACNTRRRNQQTNEWEDGPTTFVRATIWRDAAENVAESLTKGDRVLAHGTFEQTNFEDKNGNKRTSYETNIEAIGPSLRWATASVSKVSKNGNGGGNGGGRRQSAPAQDNGWGGESDDPGWG